MCRSARRNKYPCVFAPTDGEPVHPWDTQCIVESRVQILID